MVVKQYIYGIMKKVADFSGYYLTMVKKEKVDIIKNYELIVSGATYAPWLSDDSFNDTFGSIKDYTLVDKLRCYELWQLIDECLKLEGALIEIGVWRGGSGALIAHKARLAGIKDAVYLCDTFAGVVKTGEKDSIYKGGEHSNASKADVEEILNKFELDNVKILVGIFPDETSVLINDDKFRFCHIDVDVYQSAKDILEWIWPKLVVGGIVVFDDYGFQTCDGITLLVNEERKNKDRLVIHNINGHAIIIKLR